MSKTTETKEANTLEFLYQETQIHFLVNPNDKNVMVNATEMAKVFGRRTKDYLKNDATKKLIESFETGIFDGEKEIIQALNRAQIIQNRSRNGIYFHRELALDFAMWLDPIFKRWILSVIDEIIFGNYKKHWDAHQVQLTAEKVMEDLKPKLLTAPTPEMMLEYFEAEKTVKTAKYSKRQAINSQYKMNF